jgi:peptide/nickel transport system ATP-binding protein
MIVKRLEVKLQSRVILDISFKIETSLALVGESGSGKSLTLKSLLGMLPQTMKSHLEIESEYEFAQQKSVALIPQNPFTSLSPLTKIKKQFFVDRDRIEELFGEVGLDVALLERFPPELSGGQLQRVVIAMALSKEPKLLLLDEPTTALDPESRKMIVSLLKKLQKREKFKMLFVTHDISSAKDLCEDIVVLKSGKVVEYGKMSKVIQKPQEIYTKTLIEANFANRKFRK